VAVATAVMSMGHALALMVAIGMIVGSAPVERAGAASALSETGLELGGALGIALLGSLGTAVYRSRIAGAIPADVPASVADAARDSIGGAVAATDGLTGRAGADLLDAARDAFTSALHAAATVGAIVMVATAVLMIAVLRRTHASTEPAASFEPDPCCA
jgi:DHA2 family multidrug resistance protein-like MFS transporter